MRQRPSGAILRGFWLAGRYPPVQSLLVARRLARSQAATGPPDISRSFVEFSCRGNFLFFALTQTPGFGKPFCSVVRFLNFAVGCFVAVIFSVASVFFSYRQKEESFSFHFVHRLRCWSFSVKLRMSVLQDTPVGTESFSGGSGFAGG